MTWSVTTAIEKNNAKIINVTSVKDFPKLHQMTVDYINQTDLLNEKQKFDSKKYDAARMALSEMKANHDDMTIKLMHVLHGDVRTQFFNLFDYREFIEKIDKENRDLSPNGTLPIFDKVDELFELSKIITSKNNTHIRISLEIPVISTEMNTLLEFIPVPFKLNDSTHIIASDPKYYFLEKSNKASIIPNRELNSCLQFENLTLCSTDVKEKLDEPDLCMDLIIFKRDAKMCSLKEIMSKNYYIHTSDFSTYCYILNETKIRITCNRNDFFYTLTSSDEINYENECDFLEIENEIIMDRTSESVMEVSTPLIRLNFTIFDSIHKKWMDNVTTSQRHEFLEEIKKEAIASQERILKNELENNENKGFFYRGLKFMSKPFEIIVDFLANLNMIWHVFIYLVISPLIICTFYSMFVRKKEK